MRQTVSSQVKMDKNNKPILSQNPQKAMGEMITIIDHLRGIMQEENAALEKSDTQAFTAVQSRKIEAAQNYRDGVQQLMARQDDMKVVSEALKKELQMRREDFMRQAKENLQALERMRKGMQRLSQRIMNQAKKEAAMIEKVSYGASGALEGRAKGTLGLNESA